MLSFGGVGSPTDSGRPRAEEACDYRGGVVDRREPRVPSWIVIITSTNRETSESTREVFEVTPVPVPGSEHAVLVQLVTGIHPGAAERSYDGDTVAFDDGRRVIVARFEIDGTTAPVPLPDGQRSLFDL